MRVRRTYAVAVVGALAIAGISTQAGAASKPKPKPVKPVCNLLTDDAGDASFLPGVADDNLDILSADVATSAKTLTVELRLKSYSATDTNAPFGRNYYVLFSAPGQPNPIFLSYSVGPLASSASYGDLEPGAGASSYTPKGTATVAVAGTNITLSAPIADLSSLAAIKPGTKLTDLNANATVLVGVPDNPAVGTPGVVFSADTATGGKSYIAGTPSCVKVTP